MSTISLQVGLLGSIAQVQKLLQETSPAVEKVLDTAEAVILNRIRTRFLAEVDTDGKPWIPSKAGQKRRSSGGTGTLFASGALFHSIHAIRVSTTERSVTFDQTQAPYGVYHMRGTKHLPKREFLGVNSSDVAAVTSVLTKALERGSL
ncbi:MAG: hypothetical protein GQ570_03865 [Helicobacteraceae bacterium]|nr:hypothetical protein [Helicobacteraceae bacterium]